MKQSFPSQCVPLVSSISATWVSAIVPKCKTVDKYKFFSVSIILIINLLLCAILVFLEFKFPEMSVGDGQDVTSSVFVPLAVRNWVEGWRWVRDVLNDISAFCQVHTTASQAHTSLHYRWRESFSDLYPASAGSRTTLCFHFISEQCVRPQYVPRTLYFVP